MQTVKIDRLLRISIGLLAVALIYVIYGAIHERVIGVGDSAPEFSIQADNGRTISVPDFGGKVLVLNFWASWCPPCVEETPSLSQFAQQYASKGVVVLAVSVDQDPSAYRNFLQRYKPAFLTVRDSKIHEEYGTFMYPESYIINPQGKVLQKIAAAADWTDPSVTSYINSLL
ncbi:MAG TPA: TlpA disulfide reductase family protein [Bryobacteraceae bacterium]|nr:TlpA disulfide reductase family protein [Bryobacteraceae bacterium]